MHTTRASILSTLALADAESLGTLSFAELYWYVHKNKDNAAHARPSLRELSASARQLARDGIVFFHDGRYALRKDAFESVYERAARAMYKIKRARTPLLLLSAMPFVHTAALTGSLAMGGASVHSDIDLLCVVRRGRIWTARACALALAELFGMRRERSVSGEKLCFNYFLADNAEAPVQNVASANMFARAIPVAGTEQFISFLTKNRWLERFLHIPLFVHMHKKRNVDEALRTKPNARGRNIARACARSAQKTFEFFLDGKMGNALEKVLGWWQKRRLEKKRASGGDTSHFIFTDEALLLHYPNPKNKMVMRAYQKKSPF